MQNPATNLIRVPLLSSESGWLLNSYSHLRQAAWPKLFYLLRWRMTQIIIWALSSIIRAIHRALLELRNNFNISTNNTCRIVCVALARFRRLESVMKLTQVRRNHVSCHRRWLAHISCFYTGTSAGFWLGGSMPPCRLRQRKFWKFDYEMVHSEVYLNKICGQHSAVLYTCLPWFLSKYNINIENCSFFACFCFLIFHPFY